MLRTRVIPVLLLYKGGLYKTIKFKNPRYIGDPINAIKLFNEKEVDELVLFDISASEKGKTPDFALIEEVATECFMPICYGGGVKKIKDAKKIFRLGVEKVSVNSAVLNNEQFLEELSNRFGKSSIVVTIDVKKNIFGNYYVYANRGKKNTGFRLEDWISKVEKLGAGEIIINNIDREGTMKGYDIELIKKVKENTTIPFVICGGAGEFKHLEEAVREGGTMAVGAGSLFIYWGRKKGVLINYPTREKLDLLDG